MADDKQEEKKSSNWKIWAALIISAIINIILIMSRVEITDTFIYLIFIGIIAWLGYKYYEKRKFRQNNKYVLQCYYDYMHSIGKDARDLIEIVPFVEERLVYDTFDTYIFDPNTDYPHFIGQTKMTPKQYMQLQTDNLLTREMAKQLKGAKVQDIIQEQTT